MPRDGCEAHRSVYSLRRRRDLLRTSPGPTSAEPDSVHLADWPERDESRVDDDLRRRMAAVRKLVALGRSARTDAKVRVRQPLARALTRRSLGRSGRCRTSRVTGRRGTQREGSGGIEGNRRTRLLHGQAELQVPGSHASASAIKDVASALAGADPRSIVESLENEGVGVSLIRWRNRCSLRRRSRRARRGPRGILARPGRPLRSCVDLEISPELEAEGIARELRARDPGSPQVEWPGGRGPHRTVDVVG